MSMKPMVFKGFEYNPERLYLNIDKAYLIFFFFFSHDLMLLELLMTCF